LNTRDTVIGATPACAATSVMRKPLGPPRMRRTGAAASGNSAPAAAGGSLFGMVADRRRWIARVF